MATLDWAWQEYFVDHERDLKLALADARVTNITRSRQQYMYYLDDNELESYDFNGFVHTNPALRQDMSDTLGYDPSDLGHYLRRNDRLTKAANSPLVTVHRGSIVTHWILYSATPESKVPPPKKYVVMDGDTILVHELSELFQTASSLLPAAQPARNER
ncbi:hypothetical protein [Hymenobacter sp. UYAg731]